MSGYSKFQNPIPSYISDDRVKTKKDSEENFNSIPVKERNGMLDLNLRFALYDTDDYAGPDDKYGTYDVSLKLQYSKKSAIMLSENIELNGGSNLLKEDNIVVDFSRLTWGEKFKKYELSIHYEGVVAVKGYTLSEQEDGRVTKTFLSFDGDGEIGYINKNYPAKAKANVESGVRDSQEYQRFINKALYKSESKIHRVSVTYKLYFQLDLVNSHNDNFKILPERTTSGADSGTTAQPIPDIDNIDFGPNVELYFYSTPSDLRVNTILKE